ncbi:MAG: deoxyribose-phosphate aldolase [Planctomycetia bacterium]
MTRHADPPPPTRAAVARALDQAVLKPEATGVDLVRQAAACVELGVGCLCVRSVDVAAAARLLAGTPVVVASVIAFPHGAARPEVKAREAALAIADGGRELDMVMNLGACLSGDHAAVRADIAAVVREARPARALVKVILETCHLTATQIATACRLAEEAGADFVKTSTGFGPGGATPEAVQVMLDTVGDRRGVKASGGIRTWDAAVRYLRMGCSRLGVGDAAGILAGRPADPGS